MLLSIQSDPKTVKGQARGYMTAVVYLAASDTSGIVDVCPSSSAGCRAVCLGPHSGRAAYDPIIAAARTRRTKFFAQNRTAFVQCLHEEIAAFVRKCDRAGFKPAVRLNGTSDIRYHARRAERALLHEYFTDVQWYDYTAVTFDPERLPHNLHLTFSRKENNVRQCHTMLRRGANVAVVFGGTIPAHYWGIKVIDGDADDLRFLDASVRIVGLTPKGVRARGDTSGFIVRSES